MPCSDWGEGGGGHTEIVDVKHFECWLAHWEVSKQRDLSPALNSYHSEMLSRMLCFGGAEYLSRGGGERGREGGVSVRVTDQTRGPGPAVDSDGLADMHLSESS